MIKCDFIDVWIIYTYTDIFAAVLVLLLDSGGIL